MTTYLSSSEKQFRYYKGLTERAIIELNEDQLFQKLPYSNSIAIIMQHMAGNMLSRWTDLFETDGEKEWRNRDQEFKDNFKSKKGILNYWEEGWYQLFATLDNLTDHDLNSTVYIRSMGHSLIEAINRQLCHYAYHVGQIVFIAKQFKKESWKNLSIPEGESVLYNEIKNSQGKRDVHFTDDL